MPGYREITVAGDARPRRPAPARRPVAHDRRGALAGTLAETLSGALSGAIALCRASPGTVLGALAALGAAGFVSYNALSHQAGPHPAPILPKVATRDATAREPMRDVTREPVREAAKPESAPAPKPAARDAIGELIRSGETTASVTPKPDAARAEKTAKPVTAKPETVEAAVLRAQRALAKLGYGPVKADGAMGPSTRAAIERFERGAKLPVTGEAAGRTLRALVSRAGQG